MPRQGAIHYGWVIVVAGFLTVFASLGLARFGLGMLLPSMGAGLGLSYSQMGLMSTGNFVGYLAAVLAAGALVRWIGTRWTITGGLAVVSCSMLIVSRANAFGEVLVFYALTGVASGIGRSKERAMHDKFSRRIEAALGSPSENAITQSVGAQVPAPQHVHAHRARQG